MSLAALKPLKITEPWYDESEWKNVQAVLASGQLVQAGRVREFEQLCALETGLDHAIMVSSGTAALHLAMLALDIGPGDAVAVPDFTFVATANAVARTGATPVFVDVLPESYNMDPDSLREVAIRMTGSNRQSGLQLRMILPVHQFGLPAEMDKIMGVAQDYGLIVVEDAACALGSRYRGRPVGAWGLMSCLSFHPRKVITTGEGGAVLTNDGHLAGRVRALRAHGFADAPQAPELVEKGLNYRMTELQAALGIAQLGKLEMILQRRRQLARSLTTGLTRVPWFIPPRAPADLSPNWQSYVGLLDQKLNRHKVMQHLAAQGIETRPGATALHRLKAYRDSPAPGQPSCPVSAMLDARTLTLPLHPKMDESDVERIVAALYGIAA
jgi:dTDP-4-amino-4,6-dideoxygalactose transaminase